MIHISKQQSCQRFVYKIHSSRLRKSRWKLTLPLSEARRNDEVISLADSQVLRWIDELNGITDADDTAREIKREIKRLKSEPNNRQNRKAVRRLYSKLDNVQFKPDYLCLIIDRDKDYRRACQGFSINGMNYKRLLGTNGGIKSSTIVFISERYIDEIRRRVDNGRRMTDEFVPAKLEAYKALTCSASTPVSTPHGILVVKDCETKFLSDIIYLNDECDGEPEMEFRPQQEIELDASDGFGLMLPSLAERWSQELGLDYVTSGVNTRYSFEKGMIFTFDFIEFAEKVAHSYYVQDVWGHTQDIRNVELILTESQLKLWSSYDSIDDYVNACDENGYTFGITKVCPAELESERNLNYQFIQSYDLDDNDIEKLTARTVGEVRDVLGGDWAKAVLFLRGTGMTEKSIENIDDGYIKAIMIDHHVLDDPFVRSSIYQLIKHKIDEAKVGVLKIHGNYSIISGDPYALCQSMFGLPVTGLLKAGEIYNQYWVDRGAESLACFRAPMTCHNNIRLVHPCMSEEAAHWYQYYKTATIFNAWDTAMSALNGADFDGDMVLLSDDTVLVGKLNVLPAIMCVQRRAAKKVPLEQDTVRSNIESFGNDIGKITNRITTMFEVASKFPPGSRERQTLAYRIKCGQLLQQNSIDRAKGIISKPMPRTWYDRHAINQLDDEEERRFQRSIVAERKPYFMRYVYPDLMRQYNTYIKNTTRGALREFQMTVDELMEMPYEDLSERQIEFLRYYDLHMPVGEGDCVMNKICRLFEREFDGFIGRKASRSVFDYSLLKSDEKYTYAHWSAVKRLYDDFQGKLRSYAAFSKYERLDDDEIAYAIHGIKEEFKRECESVCQNEKELCNILLDICYKKASTKHIVWNLYSDVIIKNLLEKNDYRISAPIRDDAGDIEFGGLRFSIISRRIGVDE